MNTTFYKLVGYGLVVLGCALTFVSAFTPQLALGYYLQFGVVLIGLLPYVIYSIAVTLYESMLTIAYGLGLIGVHTWMVMNVRFIDEGAYSDALLYYGPVILSVALLTLFIMALRVPYR